MTICWFIESWGQVLGEMRVEGQFVGKMRVEGQIVGEIRAEGNFGVY